MTLFKQNISPSLPTELALYKAAQGAMSTIILKDAKELDLSRLTFVSFEATFSRKEFYSLKASGSIKQANETEAGSEHLISVELEDNNGSQVAKANFLILERNRGLKSSVLHNLRNPKKRIETLVDSKKTLFLEQILKKFPDLHEGTPTGDCWPLDALFASAIETSKIAQGVDFKVNFEVFSAADSQAECEIIDDPQAPNESNFVEIIQNGRLVAQFSANTVL